MNVQFGGSECSVQIGHYYNHNTRIQLYDTEDGMPMATASVNVPEKLEPKEVIIKDHTENQGIYNALVAGNIIKPAHRRTPVGNTTCPVCMLK